MDLFNKKKVAELERKIAILCGPPLSATEIERREAEKIALAPVSKPTARKVMTDKEFVAAVHTEVKRLIAEKYMSKWNDLPVDVVRICINARENVLAELLPTIDILDAGHGSYHLEWTQPEKLNFDQNMVIGAGYRFVFRPAKKLLDGCKLRRWKSIYRDEVKG